VSLGVLWLRTGSLWLLIMLHLASNFRQQITRLAPAGRIAAGTVQGIMLLAYHLYRLWPRTREQILGPSGVGQYVGGGAWLRH
jgi:membrane protease YdiL (CAAX protease family)